MTSAPLGNRTTIADTDPARAARLQGSLRLGQPQRPPITISEADLARIPGACRCKKSKDERPPAPDRHPVRSNAVCVTKNPTMWVPVDRNARARLFATAKALEKKTKAKGRTDGAVGRSGLVVLQVLLTFASYSGTGRCDPSLETIAERARCCVQTVVSALDRLASIGLISVTRRWLRYFDPRTGVVHSRQITNAYHFAAADKRFWLPILEPIARSVTATTRRTLRRGLGHFKKLFQRQVPWTRADELATPLFNAL